jgi:exonuclease V gamma subunit
MKLFYSPQIEPLLQLLAQRLTTPLDDPFTPELVVVPSGDMARYLKKELARTLGAKDGNDGIVSNINFVYPRQLVNATLQNPTGSEDSEWRKVKEEAQDPEDGEEQKVENIDSYINEFGNFQNKTKSKNDQIDDSVSNLQLVRGSLIDAYDKLDNIILSLEDYNKSGRKYIY